MASKTERRREEIVARAAAMGLANVDDLAARFDVTASTIRRDLALLSRSGRLARTYGGAIAPSDRAETSLLQREREGFDAKSAIARWAAAQVQAKESILLDAGSTVALLARQLPTLDAVTVTTASVPVISLLRSRPDLNLVSLGGRLRELSDAFVGPLTEQNLERLTFDRLFLGTDGVSTDGAICEAELDQTRLKELMARQSRHVYVLAHSAKLGRAPFHSWARIEQPWTLVTDDGADPDFLKAFRSDEREVVLTSAVDAAQQ
ncbi:DeoR/GlpR family DNA-binding transcription regulator [Ruania alba]|uniref:DNA-binding transcriptional regulator of sugar metabolism, DeoR/GlpR family n=1 Tax=Ruania alba TaxID=648782 RepID=A0A1H5LFS4_9MICO|nr:DeoR/GlpR family DNA-binding transcription regulator [Ruania alba]SEE75048.1 DNA-binding transcriptional regulator of sugar metabolism, DeoR/GlpR family [Ruania alba]